MYNMSYIHRKYRSFHLRIPATQGPEKVGIHSTFIISLLLDDNSLFWRAKSEHTHGQREISLCDGETKAEEREKKKKCEIEHYDEEEKM
jgi:hypothetical protein